MFRIFKNVKVAGLQNIFGFLQVNCIRSFCSCNVIGSVTGRESGYNHIQWSCRFFFKDN